MGKCKTCDMKCRCYHEHLKEEFEALSKKIENDTLFAINTKHFEKCNKFRAESLD